MRMNRFVVGAVASLLALGTVAPAFADDHWTAQPFVDTRRP